MLKKIIIARHLGFCMGVKRAIRIAEKSAVQEPQPVTILNEIVHNDVVVEKFRRLGVGQVLSVEDVSEGTLIISAHGIAPDIKARAEAKGLNVIDATCPLVRRIYNIIMRIVSEGYYIVHVGDPRHDETLGIVGHAPERFTVVKNAEQLESLPNWSDRKLAMTVQTTFNLEDFEVIERKARRKWPQIEIFNTICSATEKRQKAVIELAPQVDMILVVGSKTSANSNRLVTIAQPFCSRSFLVNTKDDIKEEWFTPDNKIQSVGITAGASTPDSLVIDIVDKLIGFSGGTAEVIRQEGNDDPECCDLKLDSKKNK